MRENMEASEIIDNSKRESTWKFDYVKILLYAQNSSKVKIIHIYSVFVALTPFLFFPLHLSHIFMTKQQNMDMRHSLK